MYFLASTYDSSDYLGSVRVTLAWGLIGASAVRTKSLFNVAISICLFALLQILVDLSKGKLCRTESNLRPQDPEAAMNLNTGWSNLGCAVEIVFILSQEDLL